MATLTVRNLEDDIVRRLRIRAAEHGRSAEAEHREILRAVLADAENKPNRHQVAERLAEFRHRTADRDSTSVIELLRQSRSDRMQALTGRDETG